MNSLRLGLLASHPIQYYSPLYRALARRCDVSVYYAHQETPEGQAAAGFGVPFEWDVDLLSGYDHRFLENVARVPKMDRFTGCDAPAIRDAIAGERFDAFLVAGWHLKAYWQAVHACKEAGVPVMVRGDSHLLVQRSTWKLAVKALAYPPLLRQFSATLYVGARTREYLDYYHVPRERQFFAPHCVDNDRFRALAAASDRDRFRREAGIAPDATVFLFVGTLIPRKRPHDVVRAAAAVAANGTPVHLLFAGDGELRASIESAAREAGVPATVLGFRNQSALPSVYAAADALVLPSGVETWGLVVNEAMAAGLPAIVSDVVGCAPDLIHQGRTGWVFPVGRVDLLAAMMRRSVGMRSRPHVQRALRVVMERYSAESAANGVLEAATTVAPARATKVAA
jgi:glycosyltransferase involved in cell wall biosynthesis